LRTVEFGEMRGFKIIAVRWRKKAKRTTYK
jgi:hypothetical protein